MASLLISVLSISVGAGDKPFPPRTYRIVEDESLVYVTIQADPSTIFYGLAHNHVVRATRLDGIIEYDPPRSPLCRVEVTIPVAGLAADEPEMRERMGFDRPMSDSQRRSIDESMRDSDQLDEARHETISFRTTRCEGDPTETGMLHIEADVTARGQTASTSLPVAIIVDGDAIEARGHFTMTHADFGFTPFSSFFGAVRNSEEIDFFFEVRAKAP